MQPANHGETIKTIGVEQWDIELKEHGKTVLFITDASDVLSQSRVVNNKI